MNTSKSRSPNSTNFFGVKESLATQHLYLGRCPNLRAGSYLSTHTADLLHKILPLGKALFNSCVPHIRRPRANYSVMIRLRWKLPMCSEVACRNKQQDKISQIHQFFLQFLHNIHHSKLPTLWNLKTFSISRNILL